MEITAIDLKLLGVDVESIHVGDVVRVTSTPNGVDKDYTCSAISYNLSQFGKTKYTLGKPKQDFTKKYSQHSSSTNSAIDDTNASLGRTKGQLSETQSKLEKYIKATDDTLTLMNKNIVLNADNIKANAEHIELNATLDADKFTQVAVELDAINATLALKAEAEDVEKNFNSVEVVLDAMESELALKASTEDVNGQINEVNLTLNSHDGRITANANNIIELNSQLVSVSGDLEVLGKTVTDEIEATKSDISWMEGKIINANGINAKTITGTTIMAEGGSVSAALGSFGSLNIGGSSVSKSGLTVVSSFTQASGETAPTTNVTLLTVSLGNGVAHRPNAGDTITF